MKKDVDARDKRGHDVERLSSWDYTACMNPAVVAKVKRRASGTANRPAFLLAWYDRHRRHLPWRPPAGQRAHPHSALPSGIMLQQTGLKKVGAEFQKILARWPDVG